jgi:hypothetical protein
VTIRRNWIIEKQEIFTMAIATGIPVSAIEKDYELGWFLSAIHNRHELAIDWIFNGGADLKKWLRE